MTTPSPRVPDRLNALASEVLNELQHHLEAGQIVLGGGVALQHYCPFRDTRDLDAWWAGLPDPATERLLESTLAQVGTRHGLVMQPRKWGETQSYALQRAGRTVFSFQIAARTRSLDEALVSAWSPVRIETLRDNLGSKMNALVARGAPRDFLDVDQVVRKNLVTADELWQVWQLKNPTMNAGEAQLAVLRHLECLETRRPLEQIPVGEREQASLVRQWVRDELCPRGGG